MIRPRLCTFFKAAPNAFTGNIGSAAFPTPRGEATRITRGFVPTANAALAAASTTRASDSVSHVMAKISPDFSLNNSLQRISADFPISYS